MEYYSILRGNHKIYMYFLLALVFLMMVFPAQLYFCKILCLSLMLIFINKKFCISKTVTILLVVYLTYGLYGLLFALIKNTEFPFSLITVTFIWPLLFIPFIGQKYEKKDLIKVTQTLFFAHLFIVIYDLIFCYGVIFNFNVPALYPTEQVFSFYDTTSRLGFLNLNSITFTSPIFILVWMSGYDIGINRKLLLLCIILTFFLMILSGRRSLMGLAIAIIPAAYIFKFFFNKNYDQRIRSSFVKLLIFFSGILVIVAITTPDVFDGYWETFRKAFDSDKEPIKFAQSQMLLQTFKDNPIFGVGVGKSLFEPSPGRLIFSHQYELQYLLVLAQTGIVGFVLKMVFLVGTLCTGFSLGIKNNNLLLIYSVGLFFMMVADFTNPVLCSFDFFLSIFIILAIINNIYINYVAKNHKIKRKILSNEIL